MSQLRQKFAKRLKELRIQRGMTQEDLAVTTGLSVSFVRSIEQGIHAPSFDSIEGLSCALNVPIREFFNFDND